MSILKTHTPQRKLCIYSGCLSNYCPSIVYKTLYRRFISIILFRLRPVFCNNCYKNILTNVTELTLLLFDIVQMYKILHVAQVHRINLYANSDSGTCGPNFLIFCY